VMATMLFGPLDEIIKSAHTLDLASVRSMDLLAVDARQLFAGSSDPRAVMHWALCIDASHKGKMNLVAKLYTQVRRDGEVRIVGLNTDISNSKKAAVGAEMTIASMKEEIGDAGILRLLGGTADYCGLTELRVVCAAADELRMSAAADITVTTSLAIPSKVALGLWYEYHLGRVAKLCWWRCWEAELGGLAGLGREQV
jgi:hypothetical protein